LADQLQQSRLREYFLAVASQIGVDQSFKAREYIKMNMFNSAFGIVKDGKVSVSIKSTLGSEKLLYVLQPGEMFGEKNYFSAQKLNCSYRAKESANIAMINWKTWDDYQRKHPEAHHNLTCAITQKFMTVLRQLTTCVFNDALGRIADVLLILASQAELSVDVKEKRLVPTFAFNQHELARYTGCSRISVARALRRFEAKKIISITNGQITVNDVAGLSIYVDFADNTVGEDVSQ
jgi:CRP-like cAMP-binding protein